MRDSKNKGNKVGSHLCIKSTIVSPSILALGIGWISIASISPLAGSRTFVRMVMVPNSVWMWRRFWSDSVLMSMVPSSV